MSTALKQETPERLQKLFIPPSLTVKESLKRMDSGGRKILFVVDDELRLLGTLTDGDVRRWLLNDGKLDESVGKIVRKKPKSVAPDYKLEDVRKLMVREKVDSLPVLDSKGRVIDALFWDEIFSEEAHPHRGTLNIPVLIMAGGKGTRLDPFTRILPKPLIPVGEKPIVEHIMDNFAEYGCRDFYLTVNYKGKMIQSYFENAECPYEVNFIWEQTSLGTAGSLRLAAPHLDKESFFVTNCDIMVRADYADLLSFHEQSGADITIVGSMQHFVLPYGVMEAKNGCLERIIEKPEYDFLVNTGFYVVRKSVLPAVPERPCDFPELIQKVKDRKGKVAIYPVSQKSWLDAGQWQEYRNLVKELESR